MNSLVETYPATGSETGSAAVQTEAVQNSKQREKVSKIFQAAQSEKAASDMDLCHLAKSLSDIPREKLEKYKESFDRIRNASLPLKNDCEVIITGGERCPVNKLQLSLACPALLGKLDGLSEFDLRRPGENKANEKAYKLFFNYLKSTDKERNLLVDTAPNAELFELFYLAIRLKNEALSTLCENTLIERDDPKISTFLQANQEAILERCSVANAQKLSFVCKRAAWLLLEDKEIDTHTAYSQAKKEIEEDFIPIDPEKMLKSERLKDFSTLLLKKKLTYDPQISVGAKIFLSTILVEAGEVERSKELVKTVLEEAPLDADIALLVEEAALAFRSDLYAVELAVKLAEKYGDFDRAVNIVDKYREANENSTQFPDKTLQKNRTASLLLLHSMAKSYSNKASEELLKEIKTYLSKLSEKKGESFFASIALDLAKASHYSEELVSLILELQSKSKKAQTIKAQLLSFLRSFFKGSKEKDLRKLLFLSLEALAEGKTLPQALEEAALDFAKEQNPLAVEIAIKIFEEMKELEKALHIVHSYREHSDGRVDFFNESLRDNRLASIFMALSIAKSYALHPNEVLLRKVLSYMEKFPEKKSENFFTRIALELAKASEYSDSSKEAIKAILKKAKASQELKLRLANEFFGKDSELYELVEKSLNRKGREALQASLLQS